ncbi:HEAT repeat domain-containing protein [Streptomyces sp. H39-S7]|uniref:HEAT repeat domain-containing protein n=1 Tax=Streptomyces sp. H39-S7 TaxID=3004357 RepID=UPI0022B06BF5|nr:HEAT repeat domain-containing protein [Streptomyces sp. H39-S7]MCZ4124540.1 HEAT repeat domain-containing protein [Streptomyces sp. H39-S7]
MTTPADQDFREALHRADIGRLADWLDARACSVDVFGRLVQHADPRIRYLGLTLLTERITSDRAPGDAESAGFAALLPRSLAGPPEAVLALAGLYERLGQHLDGRPWPAWRAARLPVRVRIAWLRAELLNDAAVLRTEPPGELLYQAMRGVSVAGAHRPGQLVDELVRAGDPVLAAAALRLARQGLHAGLLAPALVRDHVVRLLDAPGAEVTADALRELAEPWAVLDPLPAGRLSPFLGSAAANAGGEAAQAALTAAARHGHRHLLLRVVDDPDLPPALRRRAMELLGGQADRGDVSRLTASAAADPLLLAAPAVTCLRDLHRRGHFPTEADVPAIIGLALADHSVPPGEVATILFTCRRAVLRVLLDQETAAGPDPDRSRRLDLLVALAGQGAESGEERAGKERAGEKQDGEKQDGENQVREGRSDEGRTDEPRIGEAITRLLASAPAEPGAVLDAIRRLRYTGAEDAVLALLPTAPAAALDTLEAIGGPRTVTALREGLGLTEGQHAGTIAPHLRVVRDRALELLWLLTTDPEQRRTLLDRLDAADLPRRIAADLGGPDERELALLSSHLDPDEPVASLCRLAAHGGPGTLPALADLLLRVVAGLAAEEASGAARPVQAGPCVNEPEVPHEVLNALSALGSRLHARGRIRPACLLDAATAREAGHALVASLVLDLLDRPGVTDGERTILLELLLRAPYPHTRRRVHRLLRNRDPQVRKHVIALLARDTAGDDAQALSASLIALITTRNVQDVQTVRQALRALGHARARWAAAAITGCLDHPSMNIKKTAAGVLARAGTPAAVPKLLFWLGHHDNPGLREALIAALRAILGHAYAATVLAAAERTTGHASGEEARARELLLSGLDGELSARSVLALDHQASPVVPVLLSLVAAGRIRLAAGAVEELASAMARHEVAVSPGGRPAQDAQHDADVRSLTTRGWDPAVAVRIAERPEPPGDEQLAALRPLLADWLRLAAADPATRGAVLRLTGCLCPAPWTAEELTVLSRHTEVVLGELADQPSGPAPADRDVLLAVLEAAAPKLSPVGVAALAEAVRALPPAPAGDRSTLTLLRRCDAVLVRADLDQALAAARLGADPWQAESAILREAFTAQGDAHSPARADGSAAGTGTAPEAAAWQDALDAAVRGASTTALEALRRGTDDVPGSRQRLAALIDAYPSAGPEARGVLLDWMTELQPLDAPAWTLAETAREPVPAPAPRAVRVDDLDQPRSTALRERLVSLLESADRDRGDAAALALLSWPEPATRLLVLQAFLRGRVTVRVGAEAARLLTRVGPTGLRGPEILPDRAALVAGQLDERELVPLIPLILEWWEHGPPTCRPIARNLLRRAPGDALADHLTDRLAGGGWGLLDLLTGRPLLRTPALERICQRLRAEGRDDLADGLLLVDGPLRGPDAGEQDAAALAALRARPQEAPGGAAPGPSRDELMALARTGAPEQIRRALTRLARSHSGHSGRTELTDLTELTELIVELLRHPRPAVRLHAHRTSRSLFDRRTYLLHTSVLLDDPEPNVVRTAVLALSHARWEPAIPAIAGLLEHSHPVVRKTAAAGLAGMGAPAVPALRYAAGHARPDRRARYTDVLEQIQQRIQERTEAAGGPGVSWS